MAQSKVGEFSQRISSAWVLGHTKGETRRYFGVIKLGKFSISPLVNGYITMNNYSFVHGKTHELLAGQISIANC